MALSTAVTAVEMYLTNNSTLHVSRAGVTTELNPWPEFGTLQIFEVIFLTLLTVLGTIGNLIVVFSIALERRVHAHGNIFIINLAVADLIVTGFVVPTVIANVIETGNALSDIACDVVAYFVTATCTCSLCNLMFIAVNRYWAVVRPNTYAKTFSRKRVYYLVAATWIWSMVIVSPTKYGWGDLKYDSKIMVCSWDDVKDVSYTYFITICAIFIPLCIIGFCYYKLFSTVRSSGRWVRSLSVGSGISQNTEQHRRSMRKEQSLLRTLATTVVLFCICWVPFGGCVLINPANTPANAKKVFAWFALSNSCVNFIIYGAMNPVFRRGYHNLFIFLFRCKRAHKISSTMLHGSFSDSFRSVRKFSRADEQRNGRSKSNNYRSKSWPKDVENSRADTITAVQTQTTLTTNSPALLRNVQQAVVEPNDSSNVTFPAQKRGIVQSLRRASLLRKPRPRAKTGDCMSEEDRDARMKRNSAMLLQIQLGEENGHGDEELARVQNERFSRRAMSDAPIRTDESKSDIPEQQNINGNCNRNAKQQHEKELSYEDDVKNSPLRGTWMPPTTVHTSRMNAYINGRSPIHRSQSMKTNGASFHSRYHKNCITTVCGTLSTTNVHRSLDDTAIERRNRGLHYTKNTKFKTDLLLPTSPSGCTQCLSTPESHRPFDPEKATPLGGNTHECMKLLEKSIGESRLNES